MWSHSTVLCGRILRRVIAYSKNVVGSHNYKVVWSHAYYNAIVVTYYYSVMAALIFHDNMHDA